MSIPIRPDPDTRVAVPLELLASLVDDEECRFDHHGGCQEHGYLSLDPGETCPQADLKAIIKDAIAVGEADR